MTPKPKTLCYRDALDALEARIVEALPDILDTLIARAKEGDTRAATYLTDRILGRSAALAVPPVADARFPYTDDDFE
jgi:hypothetical protein